MTLVRWNPARELASMEIARLNSMFADFFDAERGWTPAVDIYESSGPGVRHQGGSARDEA